MLVGLFFWAAKKKEKKKEKKKRMMFVQFKLILIYSLKTNLVLY